MHNLEKRLAYGNITSFQIVWWMVLLFSEWHNYSFNSDIGQNTNEWQSVWRTKISVPDAGKHDKKWIAKTMGITTSVLTILTREIWMANSMENYIIISSDDGQINSRGSYRSWETWKVLEFYSGIFLDWKVLGKGHCPW